MLEVGPPVASLHATNVSSTASSYEFAVTYTDPDDAVSVLTLDNRNILVTGPNGFSQLADFVVVDDPTDGSPRTATYEITPPDGTWNPAANGTYIISVRTGQISDVAGNFVVGGPIGTFDVNIWDTTAPAALLAAPSVTISDTSYKFTVTYSDPDDAVSVSTLGNRDILVTGPNGFSQLANFTKVDDPTDGSPRTATYEITPVGGAWNAAANGTYTVSIQSLQVSDNHGNFMVAGSIGSFEVAIEPGDITPPAALLSAPSVTTAGTSYTFSVTYTDPGDAIRVSTLGSKDILVTGPNGFSQLANFVEVNDPTDGSPRTATYETTPPGGTWSPVANGTYTVSMQANQVLDHHGNFVVGGPLGTFDVNIWDTTPPVASLHAVDVSSIAASYEFTVTYTDPDDAVSVLTLGSKDILVIGLNGFSQLASFVVVDDPTDGSPRTATYEITPPDGTWNPAANGTYTVFVRANQVSDVAGNFVAGGPLGTFDVDIWDTTAPTALLAAPSVTISDTSYTFTVTYADPDDAIDVSRLGDKDIVVTGPGGFSQPANFTAVDDPTDGSPRTATYEITPVGGAWNAAANGTYTVSILPLQVSDCHGNYMVAGPIGSFEVAIEPGDTTPPVASLGAPGVTTTGTSYTFNVTYTDPGDAIRVSTLGSKDIVVTGPNGFSQLANFIEVNDPTDGSPRTATYQITPPDGTWTPTANGTYTVSMQANQVLDRHGNFVVAGPLGAFDVDIWDTTAPAALLAASGVTISNTSYTFTVTYTDPDDAIDVLRLGDKDIVVTGPGGFSQPANFTAVDKPTDGSPRAATYVIAPAGGAWNAAANGTYTVSIQPQQVSDSHGNFIAAGPIGSFEVYIEPGDTTPPVASLSAPGVTVAGTSYRFNVTYADPGDAVRVSTLGSKDILVTGPNGFSQTANFVVVNDLTDGSPRTATYKITPPDGSWRPASNGTYTISMQSNQVIDHHGNFVVGGPLGAFTVNVKDTTPPVASLVAPSVTSSNTSYTFTVVYSDDSLSVATLDGNDLVVTCPNGFRQAARFVMVDNPTDGSPRTATYQITPPHGAWSASANGIYSVIMQAFQVGDTSGNFATAGRLGWFTVNLLPTLRITSPSRPEGNSGNTRFSFTVTLSAASTQPVTVEYSTQDGTAKADSDYTAATGRLTFSPGQTKKTIAVAVRGDKRYENTETFLVNLANAAGALLDPANAVGAGTIRNDDKAPKLSINSVKVKEGGSDTTDAVFTLTLSAASDLPVNVKVATQDGTAKAADGDYEPLVDASVTIPAGETKQTVTIWVNSDTKHEANETFSVRLASPEGATIARGVGIGTILNYDARPAVSTHDAALAQSVNFPLVNPAKSGTPSKTPALQPQSLTLLLDALATSQKLGPRTSIRQHDSAVDAAISLLSVDLS